MRAVRQKAKGASRRGGDAWWIAAADAECTHCAQGYAWEREVRCVECDAPMCPLCVERIGVRALCPACATEGGA